MTSADTLPKILRIQKERYGDKKVAMRKKDMGIWREYTWNEVYENVKQVSLGLESIGFTRGDNIVIIGESDPQWYWAEYAAQASGGTATGICAYARSAELLHLIQNSSPKFLFVRGQEQVDNISDISDQLPTLKRVVYWVGMGLQHYSDPLLMSFEELQDLGRVYEEKHPNRFDNNINRGRGEEDAAICYTQGTAAALPRPIILSHEYLIKNCNAFLRYDPWSDTGILVSYAPPTSAVDQIITVAGVLTASVEISFPEGPATFDNDIREMGPHYLYCVASFWEYLVEAIQSNMNRASYLKKALYDLSLAIGYRFVGCHFQRKTPTVAQRISWALANLLVLRPLRNNFGLARVRSAYQGEAFLSSECFRYLHAIGVNLKQLYGHSECGLLAMHLAKDIKAETLGLPMEDGTIEIGQNGEILYRRQEKPVGRHKGLATDEDLARLQGQIHTGDVGVFDRDGHLIILGRRDDVFQSASGTLNSFQSIEGKLRFSPYIRHAILIGGNQRDFVSAIICINYENAGEWAKSQHITYSTYFDLSQKDQTYELVAKVIGQINKGLPQDVRIRRFLNLYKDLHVDDGELTRNGNLRRRFVEEHYAGMIRAITDGKEEYHGETEVKYRDGRIGTVKMSIQIRSLGA